MCRAGGAQRNPPFFERAPRRVTRRAPALHALTAVSLLAARLAVGIDHLAGLVLLRSQDRYGLRFPELLDIVPLDVVILCPDRPRLGPFAIRAEGDLALD